MIYDCFSFYDELDILEIRFEELYPVVDKFVLIESDRSFRGNYKSFIFKENYKRFEKYKDKIIYLQYKMPSGSLSLRNEWDQKNSLLTGLKNCNENDLILFSDVDEFPRRQSLIEAIKCFEKSDIESLTFDVRRYNYFLNGLCLENDNSMTVCYGTRMAKYSYVKKINHLVHFRNDRVIENNSRLHLKDSGWHLTYIGNLEKIQNKITNWTHWAEYLNQNSISYIEDRINKGLHLNDETSGKIIWTIVDKTFPLAVQQNINKYSHLLKKI